MKKKMASPTPVTKEEFEDVLDDYPTKKDLNEAFSDYPTKKDLKEALNDYPTKADLKSELSNYPTKQDLRHELNKYATKADLKRELSNYPTKIDLRKELSNYPTKDDLKEALSNYPTKTDLSDRLTASQNAFRAEMKYEFSLMKEDLMAEMSKFANRVLTAIDPLLKELETRQQDRAMQVAQVKHIEKRLDTHDTRLTHLEQRTTTKTI